MEILKSKTVAFTGYDTETISDSTTNKNYLNIITVEFYDTIKTLYNQGFTTYLCGITKEFDLIAAEAIIKHKKGQPDIKLIVVLPHIDQENSFTNTEKLRYKTICELANKVIYTTDNKHDDTQNIHQQYLLTNCAQLVCYYNESKIEKSYLINQIIESKIPIINIFTELTDYLDNTNPIKTILTQYQNLNQLSFNKNGFILKGKTPISIPFERIKKIKKKEACLFITLKNGTIFRVSTVSNDCSVKLPKMNDNPIISYWWRVVDAIITFYNKIK